MRTLLKLTLLALLATLTLPARAQTAYVVTALKYNHTTGGSLGTFNLQTSAFHFIGDDERYKNVKALGFGANGKLYALCLDYSPTREGMDEYTIDTTTGKMILQKEFADTFLTAAGADSKGVFTGFLEEHDGIDSRLFTLDPVAKSLQVGVPTLVQPTGLVVADGLGNVYAGNKQGQEYSSETLAKIINVHTGAAVSLGSIDKIGVHTGFLYHGFLYVFGEDTPIIYVGRPPPRFMSPSRTNVYTLNLTTGAARFVGRSTVPPGSYVQAAALAPLPAVVTNKGPALINNHFRRNPPPRVK